MKKLMKKLMLILTVGFFISFLPMGIDKAEASAQLSCVPHSCKTHNIGIDSNKKFVPNTMTLRDAPKSKKLLSKAKIAMMSIPAVLPKGTTVLRVATHVAPRVATAFVGTISAPVVITVAVVSGAIVGGVYISKNPEIVDDVTKSVKGGYASVISWAEQLLD